MNEPLVPLGGWICMPAVPACSGELIHRGGDGTDRPSWEEASVLVAWHDRYSSPHQLSTGKYACPFLFVVVGFCGCVISRFLIFTVTHTHTLSLFSLSLSLSVCVCVFLCIFPPLFVRILILPLFASFRRCHSFLSSYHPRSFGCFLQCQSIPPSTTVGRRFSGLAPLAPQPRHSFFAFSSLFHIPFWFCGGFSFFWWVCCSLAACSPTIPPTPSWMEVSQLFGVYA